MHVHASALAHVTRSRRSRACESHVSRSSRGDVDHMAKIGSRRQDVLDRVRSAFVGSDGWVFVPGAGYTVRWSQTLRTPGYARERYRTVPELWPQDDYTRHVFVTLVGTETHFSVLVRTASCPWVPAQDRAV